MRMNRTYRKEFIMEPPHHTGYLGTSRVVLNHFDVSTQADIQHYALSYSSEDEMMGRLHSRERRRDSGPVAHYSKQDIREQYCISERGLGALENERHSLLFGCLSSHHGSSPCSDRGTSLLTACVRQKAPSDENLYELYKRHPSEYAPYPQRTRNPWGPIEPQMYHYDEDLKTSYFRRKPHIDPSRYTWMPPDDESVRMEKPRSIMENTHMHQNTPPPTVLPSKKHVSFARSHTMASFDDAISSLSSSSSQLNRITRSQERLLDVRKTELQPITKQPESENIVIVDKIKRAPMKTQATQTEVCLGRKPVPLNHINLSPRTIHRVKMVSQGAQTNGFLLNNGRKLIKSWSEAAGGSKFCTPPTDFQPFETIPDMHEPLQRTQSDEPPRSPFMVTTPPPFLMPDPEPALLELPQSDTSSMSRSDHESEDSAESKQEIFIDFKPQVSPVTGKIVKRSLIKTMSDGEILLEQRKSQKVDDSVVPEKTLTSISHENIANSQEDQRTFTPYFQKSPIQNEGIFKPLEENVYASFDDAGMHGHQDSIDEEFHENFIYDRMYGRRFSRENGSAAAILLDGAEIILRDECIVPSVCLLADDRLSPFASNDSLTNDARDQSDGIWNESQATVLQIDSGTDNGAALSSSELTSITSPCSASLLTPSSRRKHLLMLQHQQRSSFDTEALDEEVVDVSDMFPRIIVDKPKQTEGITRQYLTTQSILSPMRRRRAQEPPVESPQPAVVPDLLLARTDSCKTNTDVSESTTTDDYITANSGTDSSRKSGSIKGMELYSSINPLLNDGSSFESTKGLDLDDMVVPTFPCDSRLTPPISPRVATPVPAPRHHRPTPSEDDSSSSCGSYSVGSTPDLLDRPSSGGGSRGARGHAASEEEKSTRYSSSGYYESPQDDDLTWKSPKHDNHVHKKRKDFTLDLTTTNPAHLDTYSFANGKYKSTKRERDPSKISPIGDKVQIDKPKRTKTRMRSPMQNHKKSLQSKKSLFRDLSPLEKENKVTSDESSCDLAVKHGNIQISPRKIKKNKENCRRKSLSRSPTNQKSSKRGSCELPLSLPGSLSRRKSSKQLIKPDNGQSKRYSPVGSPMSEPKQQQRRSAKKSPAADDTSKLKALSAESLRSVSPGSDSVFYSDPSSHTTDHQVHCLHCGKEVDIVTTNDPDKSGASSSNDTAPPQQDIFEPPAGFEDSPGRQKPVAATPTPGCRLYKKMERRIRSEERTHHASEGGRRHQNKTDIRAKSEERASKAYSKSKLRPMAKSTNSSQEQLKSTDSSPCVLPGAPDDDDDTGIYDAAYLDAYWIYIDEREEFDACRTPSFSSPTEQEPTRKDSIASTESEQDFNKRYQAITHRMVHRKSCLEMYKRQNSKSFECDKTVIVHRESGEFGFRIHGSKPVVVSAIEPGTPAETSGLEVGDIVLSVNGISVLEKSHTEVVKIAHAGSDTLNLEVARTCYALNPPNEDDHSSDSLYNGYLWKLSGYASGTTTNKWIRRWFCLKQNNCLYYYKTDSDKQPVGVVMLFEHEVRQLDDHDSGLSKPNRFVIERPEAVPLHLAADTPAARGRWLEAIGKAIAAGRTVDDFLERTKRLVGAGPNAVAEPDCFGYLVKLGTQWKSWTRRYCVLKDACLYFYQDANAKSAFGVTYLHGYRVQQSLTGSKKHSFEIIPPDPSKKHYYFHTESDADRKRWIAALEYSIDRWLKIQ